MELVQQAHHLGAGEDGRAVGVGCERADRTVVVERRVEGHARAHAGAVDLAFVVDDGMHGIPGQQGGGAVLERVEPALADAVGEAVGVDGGGGGLQVGVVAVHQLVPEAFAALQGGEPLDVLAVEVEDLGTAGIVLRQGVEHVAHRQDGPAVGAAPVVGGMLVHRLHPAVAEEVLLRDPHLLLEEADLADGFVEILLVAGQLAVPGQGRDAHEHVIQPHGVELRPVAGKGPVLQAELLVHDVVGVEVDQRTEVQFRMGDLVLDHGHAHGAAVVQGVRSHHHAELVGGFAAARAVLLGLFGEQFVAVIDVVAVGLVACAGGGGEHGGIGHAPLIAGQAEGAAGNLPVLAGLPGRLGVHEFQDAVQLGLDGFFGGHAVRNLVVGLQQVQGRVGIILDDFRLTGRLLGGAGGRQYEAGGGKEMDRIFHDGR